MLHLHQVYFSDTQLFVIISLTSRSEQRGWRKEGECEVHIKGTVWPKVDGAQRAFLFNFSGEMEIECPFMLLNTHTLLSGQRRTDVEPCTHTGMHLYLCITHRYTYAHGAGVPLPNMFWGHRPTLTSCGWNVTQLRWARRLGRKCWLLNKVIYTGLEM